MKIWWCQEHDSPRMLDEVLCVALAVSPDGPRYRPCQFVPMRLIPDNAEGIIAREIAGYFMTVADAVDAAGGILAALDGETP